MSVEPVLDDGDCPKCGAEMEHIESSVEGLAIQQLRLCPNCYLVTWNDGEGIHMRQGVPVSKDSDTPGECSAAPKWSGGEPKKC